VEISQVLADLASTEQLRLALRMLICENRQQQDLFDFIWSIQMRAVRSVDDEPDGEPESEHTDQSDYPIQLPDTATDADYCPNPGAVGSGTIGSNDPSVALIRFASDLKGPARQLIQGNYENAAAILLRYLLIQTTDLSQFGIQRQEAIEQIKQMLDYSVPNHADDLLRRLQEQLDQQLNSYLDSPNYGRNRLSVVKTEDLPIISLQNSAELYQTLRQLGKKLASKHLRKRKKGRRKINLRQTIRANIQHGGTMLELVEHNPRLDRPKLTLITDVSSSTINATRMFLTIIWHAKQVFSDIRFFEFIGSIIDVTPEWRRAESVDQAVDQALQRWDKLQYGKQNSDYHQAFSTFLREHGQHLTSRDSIIILGDLRDWLGPWHDGTPISATIMGKLTELVKRVIVLNPESKSSWNTGDSTVAYVQAVGIEVYEVNTLQKLLDALLEI